MCGEQYIPASPVCHTPGSPPRVRGTETAENTTYADEGITPACAGNRSKSLFNAAFRTDHPRVCGEQSKTFFHGSPVLADHPRVCGEQKVNVLSWSFSLGSPPRVRGTDPYLPSSIHRSRITPACAGNSIPIYRVILLITDHPRVCGEKCFINAQRSSL